MLINPIHNRQYFTFENLSGFNRDSIRSFSGLALYLKTVQRHVCNISMFAAVYTVSPASQSFQHRFNLFKWVNFMLLLICLAPKCSKHVLKVYFNHTKTEFFFVIKER